MAFQVPLVILGTASYVKLGPYFIKIITIYFWAAYAHSFWTMDLGFF